MNNLAIIHLDDNAKFRHVFRDLLGQAGYEVHSHANPGGASAEIPLVDFQVAVVDSVGFEFARQLRQTSPECRTIVLSSTMPADASFADVVVSKASWHSEVLDALSIFRGEATLKQRQFLDVFADADRRERLRGKVGILTGFPERIFQIVDSAADAMDAIKKQNLTNCRLIQGPPLEILDLVDLERAG